MEIRGLDAFIMEYPIYEYHIISTDTISIRERVRMVCKQECERYGTSWACPPAVGTLEECERKIKSYPFGLFFNSVAEVSDVLNMEELLSTRQAHEEITQAVGDFIKQAGHEIFILSTESCSICKTCTYPNGPCRHPEKMHPCLESHGVVVSEIVEQEKMEYNLGGNTILWFSLILFR